jgi:hypothetical protein
MRRLAAIAVAVYALACAPALAAQRGIETDMTWGMDSQTQARSAAAVHDLGAAWVRLTLSWNQAEPSRGVYSASYLAEVDNAVSLLRANGARVLVDVGEAPSWETGSSNKDTPPTNDGDYASFVHAMAAHYRGQVSAWEIWNEENTSRFWSTGVSPAAYAALLEASYPAIKSADPAATVLFGGTSLNDYAFLAAAYQARPGLGAFFDALGTHPYSGNDPPDLTRRAPDGRISPGSFDGYRELRGTMLAHGDDKPIWLTEFGWATYPGGVDAATQARYLTLAFACADQDPYVAVAIDYELRNNSWAGDALDWEDQLGLLTTNFTPKPAYAAFKAYAAGCVYHEVDGTPTSPAAVTGPPQPVAPTTDSTSPPTGLPPITLRLVRARRAFAIAGRVAGASGGRVVLQVERRVHGRWVRVLRLTARVGMRGRFRRRIALRRRGRLRIRAAYRGGPAVVLAGLHL